MSPACRRPLPTLQTQRTLSSDGILFPQGSTSVIEFDVQVGPLRPGDGATNRVRLEWTSLPDDGVLAARSLSPYNEFATERYYDPGSAVNVYGAADSLTVYVPELPETGFAPGVVTELPPAQPYQDMGGMRLIIPALGLNMPIVGVSTGNDGWDLTWLWNQAGYLAGTAYPTWPGKYCSDGACHPARWDTRSVCPSSQPALGR